MKAAQSHLLLLLAIAACQYEERSLADAKPGEKVLLRLEDSGAGDLQYCTESGCTSHPNPNNCAVLEVVIETDTGRTCERCIDAAGQTQSTNCDEAASVACALITAPDPDCVVCAYIDGAVIYSTCQPAQPECSQVTQSDGSQCKVCYDASGLREVLNECTANCSAMACPAVADCGPGYILTSLPGECCPYCVPDNSCDQVVCSADALAVPSCPEGTTLLRDPANCCGYYCQQTSCTAVETEPPGGCPAGYAYDPSYPSCGRCQPSPGNTLYCMSDADCLGTEYCTTTSGECIAGPCDSANCMGTAVCYGTCRPRDATCASSSTGSTASCEGQWLSGGTDPNGCPLPPQCVCADGTTSFDGTCRGQCSNIDCSATPPPSCLAGEEVSYAYPYCCGQCVPIDCAAACPTVVCPTGYHAESSGCCNDTCVRDAQPCSDAMSCMQGEVCDAGSCQPSQGCTDSDGVDPYVAGHVSGWSSNSPSGTAASYSYADYCDQNGNVVEYTCYYPYYGSSQQSWQASPFACPKGCDAGACIP